MFCAVRPIRRALMAVATLIGALTIFAGAQPASAAVDVSSAEARMVDIINAERSGRGLSTMYADATMGRFSREWSAIMAANGGLSHRPDLGALANAVAAGWSSVAENVGYDPNSVELAAMDTLHRSFMNSAGHRANLLGDFNRVSVGVFHLGGTTYVTVNFLRGPGIAPPTPDPAPRTWAASGFTPITPVRLLDTRAAGAVAPGGTIAVRPASVVGAASDAVAVAVNVTIVQPRGAGYVTVWPCGSPRPNASNLNHAAGDIRANLVEVALGNGDLCIFSSTGGNFIVDLAGYYSAGAGNRYQPQRPSRVLDTRSGGRVTQAQVQLPRGIAGSALNVTVTSPSSSGYVTVWPCDSARPNSSNLNFTAGETVPNLVLARVPASGLVCLFSSVPSHLLVDVQGTFSSGGGLTIPADPRRALDTRSTGGAVSANENQPTVLNLRSLGKVSSDAIGAVLNVTAVNAYGSGWLTVYPCAEGRPTASNVNFSGGQTVANNVLTKLDGNGNICISSSQQTDLLVDVAGWLTN